jgi:D-alanyl-D-alanine carboxypeptidase/D-alanyl-D-alanine-endopeptidase (penicillin-binding protein 4)
MRRLALTLLMVLVAASCAADAARSRDLADRIHEIVNGPDYKKHARWGILVVDASTGEELYKVNADRFFLPASTTKLYSCAAALVALGTDHKFETPVYRTGPVEKGRLDGDLVLVASGDLTLGGRTDASGKMAFQDEDHTYANGPTSKAKLTDTDPLAGLKSLAKQIVAAGIREVAGDVLIDDRLFNHERGSGSGPDRVTPIVVNDNVVDVEVSPGERPGAPARVRVRPETEFIKGEVDVKTVDADKPTQIDIISEEPNRFRVKGRLRRSSVRWCVYRWRTRQRSPGAVHRDAAARGRQRAGRASTRRGKLPDRKALPLTSVATFTSAAARASEGHAGQQQPLRQHAANAASRSKESVPSQTVCT